MTMSSMNHRQSTSTLPCMMRKKYYSFRRAPTGCSTQWDRNLVKHKVVIRLVVSIRKMTHSSSFTRKQWTKESALWSKLIKMVGKVCKCWLRMRRLNKSEQLLTFLTMFLRRTSFSLERDKISSYSEAQSKTKQTTVSSALQRTCRKPSCQMYRQRLIKKLKGKVIKIASRSLSLLITT